MDGLHEGTPLDFLIDQALSRRVFPAVACGVWHFGRPLFIRYAGAIDPTQDTEEHRLPGSDGGGTTPDNLVGAHTLFDMASLTKPLATTLLTLKAAEAGVLDLKAKIGRYLPSCNAGTADIPIHSLLTHSSGLPAIPAIQEVFPSSFVLDRNKAVARLLAIAPERSPDAAVTYSCTGFMILGLILETVSGALIGDLYRDEAAVPLGLPRACFAPGIGASGEPLPITGAVPTEFCGWRGRRLRGQVHDESAYCMGGHSGNAGLFMSLEDVRITGSLLLDKGISRGIRYLGDASIRSMSEPMTNASGERRSFGFRLHDGATFDGPGWPETSFGHTGFTGTSILISPAQGLLAIVLTNRVFYGRNETAEKILNFRRDFHRLALRLINQTEASPLQNSLPPNDPGI